jgi:hypothetical protein
MKTLEMFSEIRKLFRKGRNLHSNNTDSQGVMGMVDITVEDEYGNIKQQVTKTNTITNAALNAMFVDFLFSNTVRNAFLYGKGAAGNATHSIISVISPSQLGLYLMNKPANIQPETQIPPYVTPNHIGLDPSVVWCNYGSTPIATEDSLTIVPIPQLCYYDHKTRTHSTQYVKQTGSGTIQSVVWGAVHSAVNASYVFETLTEDVNVPSVWDTTGGTDQWAIEHTNDETILWKDSGSGTSARNIYGHGLKTKQMYTIDSTVNVANYMNNLSRGVIMGNTAFTVARGSVSGGNINVTLGTYPTWKNGGATVPPVTNIALVFTAPAGEAAISTIYPVLVARPATGKIEVFLTTFIGTSTGDDAGMGCYVQKAVIDAVNPAVVTPQVVGWLPYSIGRFNTTYMPGFYHESKYYLPYVSEYNPATNAAIPVATSSYFPGVVMSNDFETEYEKYMSKYGGSYETAHCITDIGVTQFLPYDATIDIPYVSVSRVMAGLDLDTPITKGVNDVLRMTYKFRLDRKTV